MRLPTVTLVNKRTGQRVKMNAWHYADVTIMNRYLAKGYRLEHEQLRTDASTEVVEHAAEMDLLEERRKRNPNSPAYKDDERDYERKNQKPPEVTSNRQEKTEDNTQETVNSARKTTGRKTRRATDATDE